MLWFAWNCLFAVACQAALPVSFWVWDRGELRPDEIHSLQECGIHQLYWQVADMQWDSGHWKVLHQVRSLPLIPGISLVPVFRLEASSQSVKGDFCKLGGILADYAVKNAVNEVQIDYDCPDSSLKVYADRLSQCRTTLQPRRLTISALAHWPDHPDFQRLTKSVDALFPMFYDLDEDTPESVRAGKYVPLVDEQRDVARIRAWEKCPISWSAGLPCFNRLSLFDAAGNLKGHLHSWNWDELIFHQWIHPNAGSTETMTTWLIDHQTHLGEIGLEPGDKLVLRMPDQEALEHLTEAAKKSGAAQIVWFRLPDGGSQTPLSVRDVAQFSDPVKASKLILTIDSKGRWVLHNDGPREFSPRVVGHFGPEDRGWQLEIDTASPRAFLDASPGEFVQLAGFQDPESKDPKRVPIGEAQRLTFWFGHLSTGESLRTGVIVMDKDPALSFKLRWRVDGADWHTLE